MKVDLVDEHRHEYGIERICSVLQMARRPTTNTLHVSEIRIVVLFVRSATKSF